MRTVRTADPTNLAPNRRDDPLTGRSVWIAPARAQRPNDFVGGHGDRRCPFCAGAEADTPPEIDRIDGEEGGWLARAIPNRYPVVEGDAGRHEVLVESPRHVRSFLDLSDDEAASAVALWARRIADYRQGAFDYVLLFKNEGAAAGASLEHLHSQLVALPETPAAVKPMWNRLADSATPFGGVSVHETTDWIVSAPLAPRAAFETWIRPAERGLSLDEASAPSFAAVLRDVLKAIGRASFNLVLQIAPQTHAARVRNLWWLEVVPRDSAIAGFELATGEWINSLSPEQAAGTLRARLG